MLGAKTGFKQLNAKTIKNPGISRIFNFETTQLTNVS